MDRNVYPLQVTINDRQLSRVIIDPHYREKHYDIDDSIILELVQSLNGGNFEIEKQDENFEYFAVEPVFLEKKTYRIVLLLCLVDDFIGVINAFRVRRKKHEKN